jgi:hypothetical protein
VRDLLRQGQNTGNRPGDLETLRELLKPQGFDTTAAPELPQTTAHNPGAVEHKPITVLKSPAPSDKDRVSADPLPNATASRTNPALTQAISMLRSTSVAEVPALVQQWSRVTGTPLLRALLTQTGLTQVLQYGLGGRLLTALSHEGLSRYLSTYRAPQVLNTISQTHPGLAAEANALRTQVLKVLAARQMALKPTLSMAAQHAPASSAPILLNLQQAVQRLERAVKPAQRVQALKLLQGLVQKHLAGLQAALTAGAAVSGTQQPLRQEAAKLALGQLQQMQAWLSDPQRLHEVRVATDIAWKGMAVVLTGLAAGFSGAAKLIFQPQQL